MFILNHHFRTIKDPRDNLVNFIFLMKKSKDQSDFTIFKSLDI